MTIITIFCALLLIAYLFDLTSAKTKIPSIALFLLLGWSVRQLSGPLNFQLPNLTSSLPILGTIGLILIVLEGSLEVELNKSKFKLIGKSLLGALFPMIAIAFILTILFQYFGGYSFKDSLLNSIPFCVISSAIAIPSVKNLTCTNKEFVLYESSFSDILGVLFFSFIAINQSFGPQSFLIFGAQLLMMILISFVSTIGLSYLLSKIDHHIKFVPIILLVILIYSISKNYHLPALLFILIFGLSIDNLDTLKNYKFIEKFHPEKLKQEVQKFKDLIIEAAFLIRALFFLIFGYLIETSEILNLESLPWALIIVLIIFISRFIQLKASKLPLSPLLFMAPRGLITILLFLSIEPIHKIALVNNSLVIQVILLTTFIMMFGLITTNSCKPTSSNN